MEFDGHTLLGIATTGLGAAFIVMGIIHEATWLRRRGWFLTSGVVVGHQGDQKDGSVVYPIIEYHTENGSKSFVSKYGGGKPPDVGSEVKVAHDPAMKSEEHFTVSNRILFTCLFFVIGTLILAVGLVIVKKAQAIEDAPAQAWHSAPTKSV